MPVFRLDSTFNFENTTFKVLGCSNELFPEHTPYSFNLAINLGGLQAKDMSYQRVKIYNFYRLVQVIAPECRTHCIKNSVHVLFGIIPSMSSFGRKIFTGRVPPKAPGAVGQHYQIEGTWIVSVVQPFGELA